MYCSIDCVLHALHIYNNPHSQVLTCSMLVGTFVLLAVLSLTLNFMSNGHSHDKMYQALSCCSVLQVPGSWLGAWEHGCKLCLS